MYIFDRVEFLRKSYQSDYIFFQLKKFCFSTKMKLKKIVKEKNF